MKLTALHISRLTREFDRSLAEGTIRALSKSEKAHRIEIHVSTSLGPYSLVFKFGGRDSVIYLVPGFVSRIATTNFLPQLLGAQVESIKQIDFDRIMEIRLSADSSKYNLIFELFGQNTNLFLTDQKRGIITSLKKSTQAEMVYHPPEGLGLYNPCSFDVDNILKEIEDLCPDNLGDYIRNSFIGLDVDNIHELMSEAGLDYGQAAEKVSLIELKHLLNLLKKSCLDFVSFDRPIRYDPESGQICLFTGNDCQDIDSLSEFIHQQHETSERMQPDKSIKAELSSVLKRMLKKELRKLDKLVDQAEKFEKHESLRHLAHLLSINLSRIEEGAREIEVEDIYSDQKETVVIELDPQLSPGMNLEKIYARARKYKDKLPGARKSIDRTQSQILELKKLKSELESLTDDARIESFKRKLIDNEILRPSSGQGRQSTVGERLPYKSYQTSEGEEILVGRSAKDNDRLTFKVARKHDLWLHSQQTSGSHVVLRRPNRAHQFSKQSIIEAAELAAWFSPARNAEHVPVIYTEARYVRKARKGAPGLVVPEYTKTIYVDPRQPVR
jgi:predicted ribosome quality control (RQC) complex YloA/Tae2 family protein